VEARSPANSDQVIAQVVLLGESSTVTPGSPGSAKHAIDGIALKLVGPFGNYPSGLTIVVSHAETDSTFPTTQGCAGSGSSGSPVGVGGLIEGVAGPSVGRLKK